MPLVLAPLNKSLEIIRCRVDESTKKHLVDLGIISGEKIVLIQENAGSMIIQVKDGRIALNKDLASKIDVK